MQVNALSGGLCRCAQNQAGCQQQLLLLLLL